MCRYRGIITFPSLGVKSVYPQAEANTFVFSDAGSASWLQSYLQRMFNYILTRRQVFFQTPLMCFSPLSQLRSFDKNASYIIHHKACWPCQVGLLSPWSKCCSTQVQNMSETRILALGAAGMFPPASAKDLVLWRWPAELMVIKLHISIDLLHLFLHPPCLHPHSHSHP